MAILAFDHPALNTLFTQLFCDARADTGETQEARAKGRLGHSVL